MNKKNQINLWLDLILFFVFLVVASPAFTGNTIHEWLSIVFTAVIIIHLLFHWDAITQVLKNYFKNLFRLSRLNMVIDIFILITMTGSFLSGFLISKNVASTLGIHFSNISHNWKMIHVFTSDVAVVLLATHLAFHWKWIAKNIKKRIIRPFVSLFSKRQNLEFTVQPVRTDEE